MRSCRVSLTVVAVVVAVVVVVDAGLGCIDRRRWRRRYRN